MGALPIKVIGVGGFGREVINRLPDRDCGGPVRIAVDTARVPPENPRSDISIQIGADHSERLRKNPYLVPPRIMRRDVHLLTPHLENAKSVIVIVGMGGHTGSAIAATLANISRKLGLFTVGIVTTPFAFEGNERRNRAKKAVTEMKKRVDALIVIPFERLTRFPSLALHNAIEDGALASGLYRSGAEVTYRTTRSICHFLQPPVRAVFEPPEMNDILRHTITSAAGYGDGVGKDCVREAMRGAMEHPVTGMGLTALRMIETILIDVVCGPDTTVGMINAGISRLVDYANPATKVIFTVADDESLEEKAQVTIIAPGIY